MPTTTPKRFARFKALAIIIFFTYTLIWCFGNIATSYKYDWRSFHLAGVWLKTNTIYLFRDPATKIVIRGPDREFGTIPLGNLRNHRGPGQSMSYIWRKNGLEVLLILVSIGFITFAVRRYFPKPNGRESLENVQIEETKVILRKLEEGKSLDKIRHDYYVGMAMLEGTAHNPLAGQYGHHYPFAPLPPDSDGSETIRLPQYTDPDEVPASPTNKLTTE